MNGLLRLTLIVALFPASLLATSQVVELSEGLQNWTAPPYWTPPPAAPRASGDHGGYLVLPAGRRALAAGPVALPFIALPPCRLVDTRGNAAPLTGGFLPPATVRSYTLTGVCNVPSNAQAVSLNATVVHPTGPGFLTLYPEGGAFPPVSTLNYLGNDVIVNAAVVPLSGTGGISMALGVSGGDVILDTNGYYAPGASTIFTGSAVVNVTAAGVVNVSPAALGLPADTLTRNPVALRASAWTGTTTSMTMALVASLGLFNGTTWPVRVYDPTGAFNTGTAIVQLVVLLDSP